MTVAPDEAKVRLRNLFQGSTRTEANANWDDLWKDSTFLPWDRGTFQPALEDIVKHGHDLVPSPKDESGMRRRALVPGCGSGYDVLLLAALGFDAYGLEVSSSAVKVCEKLKSEQFAKYCERLGSGDPGQANFVVGDFFESNWQLPGGFEAGFDLIWDYTFLCALNPDLRPAWAQRHTQLLSRAPDSRLICLEHPLNKPPNTGGPPHGLSAEVYLGHLSFPGRNLTYGPDGWPSSDLPSKQSEGLVRVARNKPERTHPNGKDQNGMVTDRVSVWKHAV